MIGRPKPNDDSIAIKKSKETVSRIGTKIVKEKRAAIAQDKMLGESGNGRDILSLLSKTPQLPLVLGDGG